MISFKHLILLITIFFSIICISQTVHPISIDFEKKSINELPQNIKEGDFYRIDVSGFNPNRYSVVINNTDTILSTELNFPTFTSLSLDALTSLTASFDNVSKTTFNSIEKSNGATFVEIQDGISLYNYSHRSDDVASTILIDLQNEIENRMKLDQVELLKVGDNLGTIKTKIDDLQFKIYKYRLDALKETLQTTELYNYPEALTDIENLRVRIKKQIQAVEKLQKSFEKFISDPNVQRILNSDVVLKAKVDTIKGAYNKAKTSFVEMNTSINAENSEKLLKSIVYLDNKDVFRSFPIQFKGDEATVKLSFVPKDSASGLQTENIPEFSFPTKSRVYWKVATGFYYSNLTSERYSTIATIQPDSTTTFQLEREDDLDREAGVMVAIKGGYKITDYIGTHLSIGPGVSIQKNIRPRLLAGFGFSFGKRNSFTIDFGGILGYVERRSSIVDLDQTYASEPDPTVTKLKIANYFSVGYMFRL